MRVAIGTYVSDGNRRNISIGFRPNWVMVKANAAQHLALKPEIGWCARTVIVGPSGSFLDGLKTSGETLLVGANPSVNSNGVRYFWVALGEDDSADSEVVSWMGSGQADNAVTLRTPKTPAAVLVKRDNTLTGVAKLGAGVPTVAFDGTAVSECFSAFQPGAFVLNAVNNVNQYNSASELGEGTDALCLFPEANAKVVTWSAGASGQFIDCGGDPLAALIFRTDTTGVPAHFVTRDMHDAAPVTNLGIAANTATLAPGGIVLGSASTLRTGTFHALVFCRKDTVAKYTPPAIVVRERKAVFLPGRGTVADVDCGTSDATLKIDGAITIEWYGVAWPDQYNVNFGVHLLERGVGPAATPGAYSWGLAGIQKQDSSWSGAQLVSIVSPQWNEGAPLDTAVWRTGVLMPWGRPCHVMVVHEGNGRWLMYLNGQLVKQRRINLATNIVSGAGHRTGFGMRRNTADTAWTQAQKMAILSGRVYAAALTADQVASRFAREVMGSSESDVTTGLAEWWDARNASGLLLPASVNAANNGTISAAGLVITL